MMIAITGGTYSGKTTTIHALHKAGYPVLEESAIWAIQQLNSVKGTENQIFWRNNNIRQFQRMVAYLDAFRLAVAKQYELEKPLFWDRGIHDGLAYCKLHSIIPPGNLVTLSKKIEYDVVFVLDTLKHFQSRNETGRKSDKKDSETVNKLLTETYSKFSKRVIRVKEMSVNKRLKLILDNVSYYSDSL